MTGKDVKRNLAVRIRSTSRLCANKESRRIFRGGLGGHQDFLIGEVWRGRPLCREVQLEVVDNPIDHSPVGPRRPPSLRHEGMGGLNMFDMYVS
jgi:hypothetical protein